MATEQTDARRSSRRPHLFRESVAFVVVLLLLSACGATKAAAPGNQDVTLCTRVSDETVQAVIAAFEKGGTGRHVRLFRAPTGELNARVAADERSGGLRADVVWGCDPLTVQAWVDAGLVGGWTPSDVDAVPEEFRTKDYVGAHVLSMVAVHRTDVPAPASWSDLPDLDYTGAIAVPDPGVAASALGALGYFAAEPDYGVGFYRRLQQNGAVQVGTPDDVTTGVAQGIYDVGMTTAQSGYAAKDAGSAGLRAQGRRPAGRGRRAAAGRDRGLRTDRARQAQRRLAGRPGLHLLRGQQGGATGDRLCRPLPRLARRPGTGDPRRRAGRVPGLGRDREGQGRDPHGVPADLRRLTDAPRAETDGGRYRGRRRVRRPPAAAGRVPPAPPGPGALDRRRRRGRHAHRPGPRHRRPQHRRPRRRRHARRRPARRRPGAAAAPAGPPRAVVLAGRRAAPRGPAGLRAGLQLD